MNPPKIHSQWILYCANPHDIPRKYFSASSRNDIFENVENHNVIDLIKETHLYSQLYC